MYLRKKIFRYAIINLEITQNKFSNIQTVIFSDLENLIGNYSLITVSIFSNTTLVIGYVTLLLYTNLTLSIITFLLIPLQIWWISKSSSKIKK